MPRGTVKSGLLRQREGTHGRVRESAFLRNDEDVILEVDEGDGTEIQD
jgi:hypothetical protein